MGATLSTIYCYVWEDRSELTPALSQALELQPLAKALGWEGERRSQPFPARRKPDLWGYPDLTLGASIEERQNKSTNSWTTSNPGPYTKALVTWTSQQLRHELLTHEGASHDAPFQHRTVPLLLPYNLTATTRERCFTALLKMPQRTLKTSTLHLWRIFLLMKSVCKYQE